MTVPETLRSGERVSLRRLRARDREAFVTAVRASKRLHGPWVSPPAAPEAFDALLQRTRRATDDRLVICRNDDGALLGSFSLSQIFHGTFRNAYLGYYAFTPFDGQGYMREGLRLVCDHAFGAHMLHRLQANVQPGNSASIALVRGAGFSREGLARRYLKVGGRWRDHEMWALLAEDSRHRARKAGPQSA